MTWFEHDYLNDKEFILYHSEFDPGPIWKIYLENNFGYVCVCLIQSTNKILRAKFLIIFFGVDIYKILSIIKK